MDHFTKILIKPGQDLPFNFTPYFKTINWYRANNLDCLSSLKEQLWFVQRVHANLFNSINSIDTMMFWSEASIRAHINDILSLAKDKHIKLYLRTLLFLPNKKFSTNINNALSLPNKDLKLLNDFDINQIDPKDIALVKSDLENLIINPWPKSQVKLLRTLDCNKTVMIEGINKNQIIISKQIFKSYCGYYNFCKEFNSGNNLTIPFEFDENVANAVQSLLIDNVFECIEPVFLEILDYLQIQIEL
jgi:hypothetical protein